MLFVSVIFVLCLSGELQLNTSMSKLLWMVVSVIACACAAESIRVLVVFPLPGKSHTILGDGVVRHLVNAGHEVTYITPVIKKDTPSNLRQIDVSDNWEALPSDMINIQNFMEKGGNMDFMDVIDFMITINNMTFHNKNVQKMVRDPKEHFDVVIVEWMFSELYAAFSAIFAAPYIWVSTVQPHWWVLKIIDEPSNPAYTVDMMGAAPARVPPFTFYQRIEQLVYQIVGMGLEKFFIEPKVLQLYHELAPLIKLRGNEVPDYNVLKYNASLMLGNSHVSLGAPITLPQSYKPIGGYHVDAKVKPLPEDLKKLIDNAKNGVIYFSMGSNLKSKDFPDELKQSLLKMFGSLKQTVLWKFEENLPGLPSNVHILQWAPQPSILTHPNCKLFITHGGLLSTIETISFGKPIIGIPIFGDQFTNVDTAVAMGYAKRVDISYNMVEPLKEAIEEIINNPSYSLKAQELSLIFHDRPTTPGAELVHWVEHVAKTRGAPHLRSPALNTPFYQKYYLDLAALIVAVYVVLKKLFKRLFRRSAKKQKTN